MIPKKKMDLVERKIKDNCKSCEATGCVTCKSQVARIKTYAAANIPMDYWLLAFRDFKGDKKFKSAIMTKLKNVGKMYENGNSLAFVGNLGTGKTYAACCILKLASVSGYSVKYCNMTDIIDKITRNDYKFMDHLAVVDYLTIDEYGSRWVYPTEKAERLFGQSMERLLRERFQNGLPTIICSNTTDLSDVLGGDFARTTESLFAKYLETMYVSGKDFRKNPS